MQAKQKSLLSRVSFLDEECEDLQRQLGEKEEEQISLHNQLQQMSDVKEQQQAQLSQQQVYRWSIMTITHRNTIKWWNVFPSLLSETVWNAPTGEADNSGTGRGVEEACGWSDGACAGFKREGEAAGGLPGAQQLGSGPTAKYAQLLHHSFRNSLCVFRYTLVKAPVLMCPSTTTTFKFSE